MAGTANTADVASSAAVPAQDADQVPESLAQSESNNPEEAAATAPGSSKPHAEGAASNPAPADFSSFLSANKEQSPFAVKAGGESSAFGGGNALSFGSATGGFGAVGMLCSSSLQTAGSCMC